MKIKTIILFLLIAAASLDAAEKRYRESDGQELASTVEGLEHLALQKSSRATQRNGDTPLHEILGNGDLSDLQIGLLEGIDINAQNERGETALYLAVTRGAYTSVADLVAQGAVVDIADQHGNFPIIIAAFRGQRATVEALLSGNPSYESSIQARQCAVNKNYPEVVALINAYIVSRGGPI